MSANSKEQQKPANQLTQLEKITTTGSPSSSSTSCFQMAANTAKMPIEKVKQLIAAVSQRPSLWVRNWNNSQRRTEINRQWCEVSQEIQLSVDVCRTKWGHLRDNFRKVFIRNSFSSQPPTTWRFYNDMRFMEKSVALNVIRQNQLKAQSLKRTYAHDNSNQYTVSAASHSDGGNAPSDEDSHRKIRKFENSFEQQGRQYESQNMQQILQLNFGHPTSSSTRRMHSRSYPSSMLEESDFDEDNIKVKLEEDNSNAGVEEQNAIIELTDDDDEYNDSSSCDIQDSESLKPNEVVPNMLWKQGECSPIYPYVQVKQECTNNSVSNDADQMFLLSLLPYLQKVSQKRKLLVRQKLQQVLLDELP